MHLTREFKTGLIATLIVMTLGYLASMINQISHNRQLGTPYHVIFGRVEGIVPGCDVVFNGRVVGRVRSLGVRTEDMRADVLFTVNPQPFGTPIVFTTQSLVTVEGSLWGAKYIAIQSSANPGEEVPPNGDLNGEFVPSFPDELAHGLHAFDDLHRLLSFYTRKIGDADKAREKIKKLIKDWNNMAFDARVQANKFNQFAGLINKTIWKMVRVVDARIDSAHARATLAMAQMTLYMHTMQATAVRQDAVAHDMLGSLTGKLLAMRTAVGSLGTFLDKGDKLLNDLLDAAHKKVQEAEKMVEVLRFLSKNPRLAEQFRTLVTDMRTKAGELRAMVERLKERTTPKSSRPSSAPTPESLPAGEDSGPPNPGIPMPPTRGSRPVDAPGPAPTGQ